MRKLGVVLLVAALAGTGCTGSTDPDARRVRAKGETPAPTRRTPAPIPARKVTAASVGLQRFDACGELLTYLRTKALAQVGPYGLGGYGGAIATFGGRAMAMEDSAAAGGAPAMTNAAPPQAGVDYSGTNVQEEGVDEPDVLKTDGRRLFTIASGKVHALTLGDRPARVGSIALGHWSQELLLAGDRLLVFGADAFEAAPQPGAAESTIYPGGGAARIDILDVSDPSKMQVVSTLRLDGGYVSARMVDGVARIVTHNGGPHIAFRYPEQPGQERAVAEQNRALVRSAPLEAWLPRYRLETPGSAPVQGRLAGCNQTFHPAEYSGTTFLSVITLDPANPKPDDGASVVGAGDIVYASPRSLYVTSAKWSLPSPLLAPDAPVANIVDETQIHRFDITDPKRAVYRASGSIKGALLNQFAMSEHEGHLRVAATEGRFQDNSVSAVNVLAERDGKLEQVGHVGGLGKGESIQSVRFIGDRGYVVTFRRIDPLFSIDLSDPRKPRVTGELKIPGYSAYLHPVGDGLLLGVGQDATEEGIVRGLQVSLFDVSDPAAPKRLHNLTMPGAGSEAEWDHHAFLWWPQRRMTVIPVWRSQEAGAVVLEVAERTGIKEIDQISHPVTRTPDGYPMVFPVRRTLVANGMLLTMSDGGVKANNLDTLEDVTWVPLS